jgi:hypothetical protein
VRVPLLPKLRGHFAEFLDHSSPERLGILYQTTCVGLGYGPTRPSLEAFLDSIGSAASPLRAPHHTSASCSADLPTLRPTCLARDNHRPGPPAFLRHPIARLLPAQATGAPHPPPEGRKTARTGLVSRAWALAVHVGYGNINPLPIDYACRPRLRTRLTLGGTTWPRNPWSTGAADSHGGYRYSCLHSHSHPLHPWLTPRLPRRCDAPLPNTPPDPGPLRPGWARSADTASAVYLSPATLSARNHLTSELLRTLSRMAASKPTSWLSPRSHILSHLAHA